METNGVWTSSPEFRYRVRSYHRESQSGFNYCSLLSDLLDEFVPEWRSRSGNLSLDVTEPFGRPLQVRVNEAKKPDEDVNEICQVSVGASSGFNLTRLPSLGAHRVIAQRSDDPSCVTFMQDQLKSCRSHEECRYSVVAPLPARVIDLGLDDNHLRLYEGNGDKEDYVALSYCWGKSSVLLRMIKSNIDAFKGSIPWQLIPKTLQDAIKIVRSLGLRFIWIDCLCIIQDSRADWEIEAAKMGQYYHNALLTLAASSATSASSGLFNIRPRVSSARQLQIRGPDGMHYACVAQAREIELHPETIDDLGPLSDRGWTFQEHVLSKRIVHFTENEIIWECCTEMISEDGNPIRDNCHGMIQEFRQGAQRHPQAYWRLIVRAYSSRQLTYAKDKLPAISGLADYFQQQTGHRYLAGLWKENLPIDLAWCSWGWDKADRPPEVLPCPSWSWASIDGGVAFVAENTSSGTSVDVHVTVHNAYCTVSGKNPYGEVAEGNLNITGPLLETHVEYNGELNDFGIPNFRLFCDENTECTFFPDTSLAQIDMRGANGVLDSAVQRTPAAAVPFKAKVWCLWILTTNEEPSDVQLSFAQKPLRLHGILLTKSMSTSNIYTRIGAVGTPDTDMLHMAAETRLTLA